MIAVAEYVNFDAVGLAELVRRREVSASELLEAAILRAEAVNPRINAIVTPMYGQARERVQRALSGPLAGVPFLLKDFLQDYAGVLASGGNLANKRAAVRPRQHSHITERWLAAGLVPFGRTNTPEFGAKGVTEPTAWGPTRNPWRLEHTPGGSSGGSAAAVAARIVPAAGANDGGGSIRIPAASSGLFGLKPGRGRTPSGPPHTDIMHGAAVNHVLTRSVRDSALLLDVEHGPELGGWSKLAPPERSYLEEVSREPAKLRIGFSARSPLGLPVDPEAVRAVEDTTQLLLSLGHEVELAEPAIDGRKLATDFLRMWFAHMAVLVEDTRRQTGCSDAEFESDTLAMAAFGRAARAADYVAGYQRWNEYLLALAEFHQRFDLYMTPAIAGPAPRIGELATPPLVSGLLRAALALGAGRLLVQAERYVHELALDNLRRVPFTQLANLTGVPAMSVPLHTCDNGLPLGVQFIAPHGGEGLLLQLAGQLERARPWAHMRPNL